VNREPQALVLGTRGSPLALWQAEFVAGALRAARPGLTVGLERIRTTGDKITDVPLARVGGKSLFVKEIEEALLAGAVDVAVHSMKDVPTELPVGLAIGATPPREDPSDVLISRAGLRLAALPRGARVGTSSLRRQAQLLHLRPDLTIVPLRGNLDTRLKKLAGEGLDAIVLALAGVKRLGLLHQVSEALSPELLLPAVGQGALGIEVRVPGIGHGAPSAERRAPSEPEPPDPRTAEPPNQRPAEPPDRDEAIAALVRSLDHPETHLAVRAERAMLARLQGGCQVPIAAHAEVDAGGIRLRGLVAALDGATLLRAEARGAADDPESVGAAVAEELLRKGGRAILAAIYGEHAR
jgi:hydroxymethylbilane synthase